MTNTKLKTTDFKRNLPASILKGAAANLAIQALGKNLNKKNLLPTLAVGALGGGLSYLSNDKYLSTLIATSIFGGGNALINKTSVPKTLAKYAAIGTAARLMLNIPEAVTKINPDYETNKWKVRFIYKLPNGNLPFYHQKDPSVGCTQETLKSIGDYLGYPISFLDYPLDLNPTKNSYNKEYYYGADFELLAKMNGLYTELLPKFQTNKGQAHNDPGYVGTRLLWNLPMAITYERQGDLPHTVGINRIIQLRNIDNPKKADKYVVEVMDPLLVNKFTTLPLDYFYYGKIVLVKTKQYA